MPGPERGHEVGAAASRRAPGRPPPRAPRRPPCPASRRGRPPPPAGAGPRAARAGSPRSRSRGAGPARSATRGVRLRAALPGRRCTARAVDLLQQQQAARRRERRRHRARGRVARLPPGGPARCSKPWTRPGMAARAGTRRRAQRRAMLHPSRRRSPGIQARLARWPGRGRGRARRSSVVAIAEVAAILLRAAGASPFTAERAGLRALQVAIPSGGWPRGWPPSGRRCGSWAAGSTSATSRWCAAAAARRACGSPRRARRGCAALGAGARAGEPHPRPRRTRRRSVLLLRGPR